LFADVGCDGHIANINVVSSEILDLGQKIVDL